MLAHLIFPIIFSRPPCYYNLVGSVFLRVSFDTGGECRLDLHGHIGCIPVSGQIIKVPAIPENMRCYFWTVCGIVDCIAAWTVLFHLVECGCGGVGGPERHQMGSMVSVFLGLNGKIAYFFE